MTFTRGGNFKAPKPNITIVMQIPEDNVVKLVTLITAYQNDEKIPQELRDLWLQIMNQFPKKEMRVEYK